MDTGLIIPIVLLVIATTTLYITLLISLLLWYLLRTDDEPDWEDEYSFISEYKGNKKKKQ